MRALLIIVTCVVSLAFGQARADDCFGVKRLLGEHAWLACVRAQVHRLNSYAPPPRVDERVLEALDMQRYDAGHLRAQLSILMQRLAIRGLDPEGFYTAQLMQLWGETDRAMNRVYELSQQMIADAGLKEWGDTEIIEDG